jgi:hypothetical protein
MQTTVLEPQSVLYSSPAKALTVTETTVTEIEAQCIAATYVKTTVGSGLAVVSGAHYFDKLLGRPIWRFYVRGQHTPVGLVKVDALTGIVFPLNHNEIQSMCEKEKIASARKRNELPIGDNGLVLAEYARRSASSYLGDHLGMYFGAVNPLFVPGEPPYWQVTIEFKLYSTGPFTLAVMDVDAKTGDVVPLTPQQLEQIQERTLAIIRHQASATTRS